MTDILITDGKGYIAAECAAMVAANHFRAVKAAHNTTIRKLGKHLRRNLLTGDDQYFIKTANGTMQQRPSYDWGINSPVPDQAFPAVTILTNCTTPEKALQLNTEMEQLGWVFYTRDDRHDVRLGRSVVILVYISKERK